MRVRLGEDIMNKTEYQKYLASSEWQGKRTGALERDGYRCQLCSITNDEGTLHVHHNTYDNVGDEANEDLIVLCGKCHSLFHNIKNINEQDHPASVDHVLNMSRSALESHIRSILMTVADINQIVDPHYRGVARDAVINDLVSLLDGALFRIEHATEDHPE